VKPKFEIGDKVTSAINPDFLGQIQITAIVLHRDGILYTVAYFKDDEQFTSNMFEFELLPAPSNNSLGFKKTSD